MEDDRFTKKDREIIKFHREQENLLRQLILIQAGWKQRSKGKRGYEMIKRAADAEIRKKYARLRQQVDAGCERWHIWWCTVWWPQRMELAWQKLFHEEKVTSLIRQEWIKYLGIQKPSSKLF